MNVHMQVKQNNKKKKKKKSDPMTIVQCAQINVFTLNTYHLIVVP